MIGTDPDFLGAQHGHRRLSDEERQDAVIALEQGRLEGRITEQELAERSSAARSAITRADLLPLFDDLPPARTSTAPAAHEPTRSPNGFGNALIGVSPFVAVALFFLSGAAGGWAFAWLWFLLIPVVAIVVGGLRSTTRA